MVPITEFVSASQMAKSRTGDWDLVNAIHFWASGIVYGLGNALVMYFVTRGLFATAESVSSSAGEESNCLIRQRDLGSWRIGWGILYK